jgi:hypothetical protein
MRFVHHPSVNFIHQINTTCVHIAFLKSKLMYFLNKNVKNIKRFSLITINLSRSYPALVVNFGSGKKARIRQDLGPNTDSPVYFPFSFSFPLSPKKHLPILFLRNSEASSYFPKYDNVLTDVK